MKNKKNKLVSKIKYIVFGISVLAVFVLFQKLNTLGSPTPTFDLAYENAKNLNNSINEVFGINSSPNTKYSYIPAYSHIYSSDGDPKEAAVTLSLRNTDLKEKITILKVGYFNTKGELIRYYLKGGIELGPLETKEIFIKKSDNQGGSGANFIVLFNASPIALPPIFEAVMATSKKSNGPLSIFSSRGILIQ